MPLYLLLIMFLYGFIAPVDAKNTKACSNHCIAVVNAGSTGSRFYIYSFDLDKTNSPINIKKIWANSVKPGIATVEHERVDYYLSQLVVKSPIQKIPVYFYATAGMRLLSQKSNKETYSLIRAWFNKHHEWKLVDARTLSGEEEGAYGWLAVNYDLKRLTQDHQPLVSVIDIGGVSSQISIPVNDEEKTKKERANLFSFSLYGKKINLLTYSFLGLGVNVFSRDFSTVPSCYSNDFLLDSGAKGTGILSECINAMSKQMGSHFQLAEVRKRVANSSSQEWYIIGGISDMFEMPVFDLHHRFNLQDTLSRAETACQLKWSLLQEKYPNTPFLVKMCMSSSYWYSLLVNGYTLEPTQRVNFFHVKDTPDWTLGAILARYKS